MEIKDVKIKSDKILKFIYILLLGYIALLPFYYFPSVKFMGVKIPLIKYLPLLFIAFLAVVSFWKGYISIKDFRRERLNIYILFYFYLTLLSGVGTEYYPISFLKAVYYGLSGILIYFMIYFWNLNQNDKIWMLRNIVIVGFIVSIYGIATLILGEDVLFARLEYAKSNVIDPRIFLAMGRISSSFGSPHFLGSFISAIFPISIYLHLSKLEQTKTPNYWTALVSVIIFITTMLTFSMGAFLGVLFFCIFYYIKIKPLYPASRLYKDTEISLLLGVISLCIVLVMLTTNIVLNLYQKNYLFGKFLSRIDFHKLANIQGFTYRWESIKYALDTLRTNNCIFGMGIGKVGIGIGKSLRITMDNFYCLSLVENGLITLIFMLVLFYLIIKKGYNKLKNATSIEQKRLDVFLIGSLMVFFINMLFWDSFNHPTIRILFWSLVGFLR